MQLESSSIQLERSLIELESRFEQAWPWLHSNLISMER